MNKSNLQQHNNTAATISSANGHRAIMRHQQTSASLQNVGSRKFGTSGAYPSDPRGESSRRRTKYKQKRAREKKKNFNAYANFRLRRRAKTYTARKTTRKRTLSMSVYTHRTCPYEKRKIARRRQRRLSTITDRSIDGETTTRGKTSAR